MLKNLLDVLSKCDDKDESYESGDRQAINEMRCQTLGAAASPRDMAAFADSNEESKLAASVLLLQLNVNYHRVLNLCVIEHGGHRYVMYVLGSVSTYFLLCQRIRESLGGQGHD